MVSWTIFIVPLILVSQSACAIYTEHELCSKDVAITTGAISKHQVTNIQTCQKLCDDNADCAGFNYEVRKKKKCVLNSDVVGDDGTRLSYKPSFTYVEKLEENATDYKTSSCKEFQGCRPVWKFDNYELIVQRRDTYGWWGRDCWPHATDDYWYEMTHYDTRRNLYEYTSLENFKSDYFTDIVLPFYCDGANHIVYKRFFYCGGHNTPQIYTYDLDKRTQSTTISLNSIEGKQAGYRHRCHYHWGGHSDIDMASDEYGLWVIWGVHAEWCRFAITKLDPDTKTVVKTWFAPQGIELDKVDYGNAFMVCGNMYVMNHHHHQNTYIRWIYYTGNSSWVEISGSDSNRIILQNNWIYNNYLNYSPRDNNLYSWEHTRHTRYLAHFKDWP